MFNLGHSQDSAKGLDCRPDPEVLLQEARTRKLMYSKAVEALQTVTNMPFHLGEKREAALLEVIGSVTVAVWREDQKIERLLVEIDKA